MTWDLGAFAVEEPIGRGGAATVWRGRHRRSGLPVAIKVLDVAEPQEAEVRAVAGLDHPNVVLLFDHGVLPDGSGRPWLAMELARGTLANAAPLPWPDLRDVLERLLSALAHAHARGVFHLDLKPANVLLGCRRGEWEPAEDPLSGLRLADFGIARRVRTGERDPAHGAIVGTPAYMAPEQARGQRHRTGPWTDLYALACTAWELASGAPPFDGDSPTEILQAHVVREPPPLRNRVPVPAGFAGWLAWLLEKEPRDRALRAADAAEALRALPEDDWVEPVAATAPAPAGDTLRLDGADLPASARSPRPRRGGPPPFRAGWREPD
ncbi:MAG: serine/threonine-protein kinase, partial [Myxococcota bacterium]